MTPAFPLSSIPETIKNLPFPCSYQDYQRLHLKPPSLPTLHFTKTKHKKLMTIRRTTRSLSPEPTMPKPTNPSHAPKPPSPVNVSHFPTEGWMSHTRPTVCIVPGRIGTILGYEDYYLHGERVLCTRVFSVAAVSTTVDDGASPPGSTELDDDNAPYGSYVRCSPLTMGAETTS